MNPAQDKFEQINALSVSAAVLDCNGIIVGVNDAWRSFGESNGLRLPDYGIGANYLDFCTPAHGVASAPAADLRDLLAGRRDMVTAIYSCHSPTEQRWFFLIALPLSPQQGSGVAILHANLTKFLPLPAAIIASAASGQNGHGLISRIAETVEASVSKSLSSQLNDMARGASNTTPSEYAIDESRIAGLSKRQREILHLLGEGKSNAEIAQAVFRSPHTIKLHVSAILKQLKVKSRTQAALIASNLPKESDGGKSSLK